ncbi:MAG TPA: NAD-dependent epimerase/dehydratase family protein [Myxococcota bacterium]|nr:NAD-dependent epimerase/dehydratase family protein [Myxococcota bacterium]
MEGWAASKTVLITGVAGFIGSSLARALVGLGHRVRGIDNFATGRRENIAALPSLSFVEGDINDAHRLAPLMKGVDYVLHHAAMVSVPHSVAEPLQCHHVNATGTLAVLEAARQAQVQRVVYAASSAAYGDVTERALHEGLAPRPLSPYGASKLMGEYYCRVYTTLYRLPCVALRYFNVFGPSQDPASPYAAVIPIFLRHMLSGQPPPVQGDGLQTRDFTPIDNIIDANLLACTAVEAPGRVINIACGDAVDLLALIDALNVALGTSLPPRFLPPRPGDVRHSTADIRLARQVLRYAPRRSWRDGLAQTVQWLRGAALMR